MSSWSTLHYSFFSPRSRPFGKGVMKNIHKRGSIYRVVTAVKIRVLCIASWVLIVGNATINWGSWASQNKTWLRSQRFETSAHWCRIGFYNAVESHRESCILVVLDWHNGLLTTHFSCIVVARASKNVLVCCCCCYKQGSSACAFFPSVIEAGRLTIMEKGCTVWSQQ